MLILAGIVAAPMNAGAASVTLSWTAPTTNSDGTTLTDLSTYRIYLGTSAPACPSASFFTVPAPTPNPSAGQIVSTGVASLTLGATYFARVTAVDTTGNESACSATASGVAQPDLDVTPTTTTNFGTIATGSSADRTFTVQNTSGSSISGTASIAAPYSVLSGGSFTLASGASQTVTVRFAPSAAGTFAGNVIFSASGDSISRAVNGTATGGTTPTLTVTKAGGGFGTVTSNPAGITCGATCAQPFAAGSAVTLTATPSAGSTFAGWSGACSGTGTCLVTVNAATSVTATFNLPPVTLSVTKSGTGSGTVTSSPAGINCGTTCSQSVTPGTTVTLTAIPAAGSVFAGWSGACSGSGACVVTVNTAAAVTTTFNVAPATPPDAPGNPVINKISPDATGVTFNLAWASGNGATSYGWAAGFNDGSARQQGTSTATSLTLRMPYHSSGAASAGYICIQSFNTSGQSSGLSCAALAIPARPVSSVTLSVTKSGNGSGTVTSSPAGINCGTTCSQSITPGTAITLTATPAAGSSFAGWSGACSGTGTCSVTVNAASSVTAMFNLLPVTLSVTKSGAGSGTVTSSPAGINCGTTCAQLVTPGSAITLTATPAAGSSFAGWSGACSGTGTCLVTMNAGSSVTATFNLLPVTLSVSKSGAGSGTVTSSPAGINCGTTCSQSVTPGSAITLTATPTAGSSFAGWSGACSGTGTCSVTMNTARSVTATFNLVPVTLSITKSGAGSGTVTSSPAGINCGPTCSQSVTPGSAITLTATPAAGSSFAGWSGACSSTGTCAVTVNTATSVTATFAANPIAAPATLPSAPTSVVVTKLSADGTGVNYSVTWGAVSGAASYRYTGGFNDGSAAQQGSVTAPSLALRMPYHASGTAATGWVCIASLNAVGQASITVSCNAVPVPAPMTPTPPAAPTSIVVTKLSADGTGVNYSVTWRAVSGVASYRYTAGFNDGSAAQQGSVAAPSLTLRMPYHASGMASTGWVCIASLNAVGQVSTTVSCNAVRVPAR